MNGRMVASEGDPDSYDGEIVDLPVHGQGLGKVVIRGRDIAGDMWMIAERLRRTPFVVKHSGVFEVFGVKV